MKITKKMMPLLIVVAVIAVVATVAAAVIFTSNTVSVNQNVKNPNGAISLDAIPASSDIWAGQQTKYAITGSVPQTINNAVVTVTIVSDRSGGIQAADVSGLVITPDNSATWWYPSTAGVSSEVYTITLSVGSVSSVYWDLYLTFIYPAHYTISVSLTGEA
jgi:hypothetical protein